MTRIFFVLLLLLGMSTSAWAAQDAIVSVDAAEVHQLPNSTSPQLSLLSKDTLVKISSELTHDLRGEYWYKTRLVSGDFGYIRAHDVTPSQLRKALREAGVDTVRNSAPDHKQDAPLVEDFRSLRVMGLLGYEVNSKAFEPGGEVEFSTMLMTWGHEIGGPGGRPQGVISGGAVMQVFSTDFAIEGSLIYRFYTLSRFEPEMRLRFGYALSSGSLVGGANFGVRYPFSLDSDNHLDAYLEAGGLGSWAETAPVHGWGSFGVGYHF